MLLLVVLMSNAAPWASAADDQLTLSLDGRTWSETLDEPLFDAGRTWVAGDSATVTVWARNASVQTADLVVDLTDQNPASRIGRDLDLFVDVDGHRVKDEPSQRDHRLVAVVDVPQEESRRVTLTLVLPESEENDSQNRSTWFNVRVGFAAQPGRAANAGPPAGDDTSPGLAAVRSALASTGAPRVGLVLLGSAGCLAVGSRLLRRRTSGGAIVNSGRGEPR